MRPAQFPRWMGFAGVALAAAATYANSLFNGFALDDEFIISGNARVHTLADQASIWLTPYWPQFGEAPGLYRPLTIFGYAIQWVIGDGSPAPFHLVSVLLHIGVSLLVLVLLSRLVRPAFALLGALLFAVHPVHTEAVANIVGQAELIAAGAVITACVIHASRPSGSTVVPWRAAVLMALFAMGLLAKESAVVLPALLIALDVSQRRVTLDRRSLGPWVRGLAPVLVGLGLVFVGWAAVRVSVLGSFVGSSVVPSLPFLEDARRVPTAIGIWIEYSRLMVLPLDLSADYSPGVVTPTNGLTPAVLVGGLIFCATVILAARTSKWPLAGLAAAWFLIAILPVSNLLMPVGVVLAERTLYLPSVAVSIGAAALAGRIAEAADVQARRACAVAAGAAVVLLGVRSIIRNPDWKDTRAYSVALIRDHPESYRAQWSMAALMKASGRADRALEYMELAYRTWPEDAYAVDELARLNIQANNAERAVQLLRSAPVDRSAIDPTTAALAFLAAGRYAEALAAATGIVDGGEAVRAQALDGLGRPAEALVEWRAAVGQDPEAWAWRLMLARSLARAGRAQVALGATGEARAVTPPDRVALLDSLETAIRNGCYDGSSADCDPLGQWRAVRPFGPLARVSPSASGSRPAAATANSTNRAGAQ